MSAVQALLDLCDQQLHLDIPTITVTCWAGYCAWTTDVPGYDTVLAAEAHRVEAHPWVRVGICCYQTLDGKRRDL